MSLINAARSRAVKIGVPFDLDRHRDALGERLKAGCEMTGLAFDLSNAGKAQWNSPSFDRIRPHLGYTYDNIRVICWGLNAAFSHWGEDQTAVLMQAWLNRRTE